MARIVEDQLATVEEVQTLPHWGSVMKRTYFYTVDSQGRNMPAGSAVQDQKTLLPGRAIVVLHRNPWPSSRGLDTAAPSKNLLPVRERTFPAVIPPPPPEGVPKWQGFPEFLSRGDVVAVVRVWRRFFSRRPPEFLITELVKKSWET